MVQDNTIAWIDLDKIIQNKAGNKARYVPRFVINALKRLIHQDFLNGCLKQPCEGVEFCAHCVRYLDVVIDVQGIENFPADERYYTFASNHPLGAIDGVALGMIIGGRYDGRVKFLANDLLMNLKGLAPLCVPVNKFGKQVRSISQMVDAVFRSENHLIMFPAGLCSRRINGKIKDLPWTKTFITKSIETKRDVVPIHFVGQNSERFYRIANICKWLRLKFNFAMLLLPDEMYRSRHGQYTVKIGKPIPWQTFDKSRTPAQWAQYVQDEVYKL